MLPSGNDAAVVLSECFGLMMNLDLKRKLKSFDPYNPESFKSYYHKSYSHLFVNAMNEKCRDLGISNTVFYNPHGNDAFDPGKNISTALEIGRICFALL
jgi:D-alanyl-D-alanine carboxypeptidase